MTDIAKEFEALKALYPDAVLHSECGKEVVFIPRLKFTNNGSLVEREAILYPWDRDGYNSRLFLSQQVSAPKAQNWTAHSLLSRTWYACSWQGVNNNLSWVEILACHLRAFQ